MWIVVEDGEVFEGNEYHWADCFFSNVSEDTIRDFCEKNGWKVDVSNDYRLKHLPSGLYFCPSRKIQLKINGKRYWVKSNLAKKGKVYSFTPSFGWLKYGFYNHLQFDSMTVDIWSQPKSKLSPFISSEWIIEEV